MSDTVQPRWMGQPILSLVSVIATVVFGSLAVFFYFQSRQEREPFYYVAHARHMLMNRELAIGDQLEVYFEGKQVEGKNVTALQIYFWNSGREPILHDDILKPVRIVLAEGAEILEVDVIQQTRPDIVKFSVSTDRTSNGRLTRTATCSFDILEKDDGAILQVLYVGDPSASVTMEGVVVGAEVKELIRPMETLGLETRPWGKRMAPRLVILGYAFIPLILKLFGDLGNRLPAKYRIKIWEERGPNWWDTVNLQFFSLALFGLLYWFLFLSSPDVPAGLIAGR